MRGKWSTKREMAYRIDGVYYITMRLEWNEADREFIHIKLSDWRQDRRRREYKEGEKTRDTKRVIRSSGESKVQPPT